MRLVPRFWFGVGQVLALLLIVSGASPSQGQEGKAVFARGLESTFSSDLRKGMILVPVRLHGSEPLSFVLDSGSTRRLVDRSRATVLGLKATGTGSLQGAGAGRIPIEFIENVSLGLPGMDSTRYEFLRSYVVAVDCESKHVTVPLPQAFRASGSAQALPIELREKWPFVKAALVLPGPVTVPDTFMIDSGSGDAVDHPIVMKLQSRVSSESGVGLETPVKGDSARHVLSAGPIFRAQSQLSVVVARLTQPAANREWPAQVLHCNVRLSCVTDLPATER